MKKISNKPPMKKSNSYSKLNTQEQFNAILNVVKTLSDKIEHYININEERIKKLEEYQKIQEGKLDEIISSINILNASNGGKFDNPLLKPIEEISPNIILNKSINITEHLAKGGEDPK